MLNNIKKQIHERDIEELVTILEDRLKQYRHRFTVSTTRSGGVVSDIEINIKITK